MIRVTVDLVSAINPSRNQILGVALIGNDGHKSAATRKRLGAWDLLFLALRQTIGDHQ